ncbi:UNVERIFIED_CONTAM: hypothetical protein GTU68_048731, partial [Idotea baltica]|nr:hypothetical protein [Idotea baltica]
AQASSEGATVVFTNGCFDILHIGHTRYLADAKSLGTILVVGVNSDSSVRRLKGETRPIVPEGERVEMLEALSSVDHALLFDEDTPIELIKQVKPNKLVKGGDWPVETIVGNEFVASYGGQTLSLPFVDGSSTTSIVERVVERCC